MMSGIARYPTPIPTANNNASTTVYMHIFPQYHPHFRFQPKQRVRTIHSFPLPSSFSAMWVGVVLYIYGGWVNGGKKVRTSHANVRDFYFLIPSRQFWGRGMILIIVRLMIRCRRRLCHCLLSAYFVDCICLKLCCKVIGLVVHFFWGGWGGRKEEGRERGRGWEGREGKACEGT